MRRIGFKVRGTSYAPPATPPAHRVLRRRLEDDIEDVFDRACAAREIERAADLLELLEKVSAFRAGPYGRERRLSRATMERARLKLKSLCV
jgi:hypothetical protein